ncbi:MULTISPECIES: elongation factor G [Pelosinus]|uniref:Elongation factor G n=1 Tax=Pelosinus fermentans B4 TaxID=1149862 RepID=I9AYV0_9FIRM|nr:MULTISPECIES: elongation factor G [Pelosinus]EIW18077.1 translation elongation factor G [Pelosinus fermentans B4]EIW24115.1 translation elongation factor G [Pelosinus fermentans A11]OAM94190.1 translation elongation factor G [Pelosinus fermentans DSM 17108]SDR02540.1 elongation factor G [Pelosinus fermentans]
MKEYRSDKLRSVGIVAHGGAGKTSVAEALLFNTGAITRIGRVDDGTTTTDFEPEEIKRKVTISAALAPCEWRDHKINFIDTPGYADFVGEVKSTLRAVDSALVVVCAASGVEVETEKAWQYISELNLPRIVFINKMDRENADFHNVIQEMKDKFGSTILPIQLPIGAEENFKGIIDLVKMKAILSSPNQRSQGAEADIPENLRETALELRQKLIEVVAESDDDLLAKYLDGEELSDEEIKIGILKGAFQGNIIPVMCGAAYKNIGIQQIMNAVLDYTPSSEASRFLGTHPVSKEIVERKASDGFSALVFKTTADPFVGRLSYIRIFSGSMKPDSMIYNASKEKIERFGNLFTLRGKHQEPLNAIYAGDIAVVAKLQETGTGDTLCEKDKPIIFEPITYPKPMFTMSIEAKNKGDEDKIGNALNRLMDEDRTFKVVKNVETKQLLVSGIGELHTDIMAERMKRKFGVDVILSDPKVPYRETIRGSVKVEGKHKKQSGGHGQYGHVWLQLDPLPMGTNFEFVDSIFGGAVPRQYIPAVEKGVREALVGGILGGYPMVDVKVTLYDGSYHNVDSSEMAFKIASTMALRKGALQAKPALLEPICNVNINVPDSFMGDVIADLNGKRGRIQGMEPITQGAGVIKAQVPMSEMFRYAIDLRSITQGRGYFDLNFSHYEEVPQRIAEMIIATSKNEEH